MTLHLVIVKFFEKTFSVKLIEFESFDWFVAESFGVH